MTPLETADGWFVYVNRGFVPAAKADPATRLEGQVEGETTVIGALRPPARRSVVHARRQRQRRTSGSRALPRSTPLPKACRPARWRPISSTSATIRRVPAALPQGGETVVDLPNNHLGYAITWYGLALGLALVFVPYLWKRLSERRAEKQAST